MGQMLKSTMRWASCVATAVALAVVFGVAQRDVAGAQEQAGRTGGPREGIKVHGHWAINVRQPDGTLVRHTEFENALTDLGAKYLASILGHEKTMDYWVVNVSGQSREQSFIGYCLMAEANAPLSSNILAPGGAGPDTVFNKTLTVRVPHSGEDANMGLVLEGSCVMPVRATIDLVKADTFSVTSGFPLFNTVASGGSSNYEAGVTSATLPQPGVPPVVVERGQMVQVKVILSFS